MLFVQQIRFDSRLMDVSDLGDWKSIIDASYYQSMSSIPCSVADETLLSTMGIGHLQVKQLYRWACRSIRIGDNELANRLFREADLLRQRFELSTEMLREAYTLLAAGSIESSRERYAEAVKTCWFNQLLLSGFTDFFNENELDLAAMHKHYLRWFLADISGGYASPAYEVFLREAANMPERADYLAYLRHATIDVWQEPSVKEQLEVLDPLGYPTDAVSRFTRALERDADHSDLRRSFALYAENVLHDYDLAEKLYQEAIERDRVHGDSMGYYGTFLWNRRGDYEGAMYWLDEALEFEPGHEAHDLTRAELLNLRSDC